MYLRLRDEADFEVVEGSIRDPSVLVRFVGSHNLILLTRNSKSGTSVISVVVDIHFHVEKES